MLPSPRWYGGLWSPFIFSNLWGWSLRHSGVPTKDPRVTRGDWLAGLSRLFGSSSAPWVSWPDGVIISICSGQLGPPRPVGLGVLGLVPLLSPRHPQTLGLMGPEVSIWGSAGGLFTETSGTPVA